MRTVVLAAALALLTLSVPAEAQKNCRKGIPCGNSCIAANKTCRIGSSSGTVSRTRTQAPARLAGTDSAAAAGRWVASSRGTTYYLASCSNAKKLSPANRVYFKTEEEAKAAGYKRSASKGC